jgi:TniQ
MRPRRLPIPLPPAHQETISSYLIRLATLHGLDPQELWEPISIPTLLGGRRRTVAGERLADLTGRRAEHLAWALPELRQPAPDWTALRHQGQGGCPRCDARHLGGPVTRLLAHHRYVCTRHRYWIGPPDIDQPATPLAGLDDIVAAQRHHLRLLHRHGCAMVYDAVLTGLMICGHFWNEPVQTPNGAWNRWTRRADLLIPPGTESGTFSASRLFAAVYPEAVNLAALISSPTWRRLATGDTNQQQRFSTEVAHRLGDLHYQPPGAGDAVTHWMTSDAPRPPSRPTKTFPDTRAHGATRPATTSAQSRQRHDRSSLWFGRHRRGGGIILHHRHIQPVLIREWSTKMDGFAAQIWASRATPAI